MATANVNSDDFSFKVLQSEKYVLVDFWAPWCVPCQMMAPILEELTNDTELSPRLEIAKVNTEERENRTLAVTYQVQSIPNMKLFHRGEVVAEFIGLRSGDQLKKELLEAMNRT